MSKNGKWIVGATAVAYIIGWTIGDERYQEYLRKNWEPSEWLAVETGLIVGGFALALSLLTHFVLIPQSKANGVRFWVKFLAGLAFAGTLVCAPFQSERTNSTLKTKTYSTSTAPIWSGPSYPAGAKHTLQLDRLLTMWVAIGIAYFAGLRITRPNKV